MATTKFFIQSNNNPANIYLNLSVSRGKIFRRKTGYSIDPADWSEANDMPKQNDEVNKRLNIQLTKLAATIDEQVNNLTASGGQLSGEWLQLQIDLFNGLNVSDENRLSKFIQDNIENPQLKEFINTQIDRFVNMPPVTEDDKLVNAIKKYIDALPFKVLSGGRRGATVSTAQKYTTMMRKVEAYQRHTKKTYLVKEVNPAFIEDLLKFFREVLLLGTNTAGRYIKFLKTACLNAQAKGIEVSPQLKLVRGFTEKSEKIYLTFDELEKIEAATFTRPALENARDWLVIGCYIGQRVGDLLKLTTDNIVNRAGLELIELTQEKTGKNVSIPIHPKVKTIVEKYGGNFPYLISDQRFNEYIKDVCKLAGITQLVTGGKMVEVKKNVHRKKVGTFPKYELVTSHICRRSFASNFYGEMPTALLISITAHSTEQQFLQYIGKTSNDYAVQIAEYWRKQALQAEKKTTMTVIRQAK